MSSEIEIGDVYQPKPSGGAIGRIVIDHVAEGTVFGHRAFDGRLIEGPIGDLVEFYDRDAAWCDGRMATIVHPGMDGDGI